MANVHVLPTRLNMSFVFFLRVRKEKIDDFKKILFKYIVCKFFNFFSDCNDKINKVIFLSKTRKFEKKVVKRLIKLLKLLKLSFCSYY